MERAKRASMREGPLADLFRRTEAEEAHAPEAGEPGAPRGAGDSGAPGGTGAASTPGASPAGAGSAAPAEPSRTPEDRLRAVFSADIPENIMEPATAAASAPRYGREQPRVPIAPEPVHRPVLRVVGVGGAGVNAVDRMVEAAVEGVEFVAVNTDMQSLRRSSAHEVVQIGGETTRGLGSGSDPDLGRRAAMEDYDRIKAALKGSDMVFITAGAGGGTGTGAAPVVARMAREVGALTVGVITKPFTFEGLRRMEQAEAGIEDLANEVDTLIVIPNARLLAVLDRKTSMVDAFRMADDVLRQGVQGISDLIMLPGLINLDFADVRTIMSQAGQALLGIGMGTGEGRAVEAAQRAVASPLLETSVDGARSILLSITAGRDMSLWEVNEAARAVAEAAHPDANIIFGAMVDESLEDQVWVTVVATGYGEPSTMSHAPEPEAIRTPARGDRARSVAQSAREADREPRVVGRERKPQPTKLGELDVPEFIPRG